MILAIVGPTGVGKTKMSVSLAHKYNAIIINCDAMQVYKGLNIGTAKIREEEKEGVEHYLFDIVDPTINYTAYDYQRDARKLIEKNKDKNIILVGGTGLYLKALLYDYEFPKVRVHEKYNELTLEELRIKCREKDSSVEIHPHNREAMLSFLNDEEIVKPISKQVIEAKIIGLTTERDNLYNIINNRVDKMVIEGLVEEVKYYYDKGIRSKALTSGIGYKEIYDYFDNKVSLEDAIENIKKNSRHYAKRQYTFFNHQLDVKWFNVDYDNFNNTIKEVEEYLED